jgi:hypothetical protein
MHAVGLTVLHAAVYGNGKLQRRDILSERASAKYLPRIVGPQRRRQQREDNTDE